MIKPNGMFLKLYMSYLKDDPIAAQSHHLIKALNQNWNGASASLKDLTTHYFDDPKMENLIIDLPFTKETWHGRIMASRGVLASMDSETLKRFEKEHYKLLEPLPDQFFIKHKVFLTYYYITK